MLLPEVIYDIYPRPAIYLYMHLHAFTEEMEIFAPPALAEEFDAGRIGLVVEGRPR